MVYACAALRGQPPRPSGICPSPVVMVVAKVNISKPLVTKLLTDMVFDDSLLKLGRIMPEMRRIVNSAHSQKSHSCLTRNAGAPSIISSDIFAERALPSGETACRMPP